MMAAPGLRWAPSPVSSSPWTKVAAPATSSMPIDLAGVPLTDTVPSATSRSSGSISSSRDATARIRSRTWRAAFSTALPATNVAREAKVPVHMGDESVLELS